MVQYLIKNPSGTPLGRIGKSVGFFAGGATLFEEDTLSDIRKVARKYVDVLYNGCYIHKVEVIEKSSVFPINVRVGKHPFKQEIVEE